MCLLLSNRLYYNIAISNFFNPIKKKFAIKINNQPFLINLKVQLNSRSYHCINFSERIASKSH